jgi:hypothetical protein
MWSPKRGSYEGTKRLLQSGDTYLTFGFSPNRMVAHRSHASRRDAMTGDGFQSDMAAQFAGQARVG